MPSTTTGLKDVVVLVLKFMRSSLHFVSFFEEARVDQVVDGGLDVTVLVLDYCLRDGRSYRRRVSRDRWQEYP